MRPATTFLHLSLIHIYILDPHKISSKDPVGGLESALCPHENTYDLNAFSFQVLYLFGRVSVSYTHLDVYKRQM